MARKPLCPHCDAPLERLEETWADGMYTGAVTLVSCPACHRLLSILPRPA